MKGTLSNTRGKQGRKTNTKEHWELGTLGNTREICESMNNTRECYGNLGKSRSKP